jgi:hypothetical protein
MMGLYDTFQKLRDLPRDNDEDFVSGGDDGGLQREDGDVT